MYIIDNFNLFVEVCFWPLLVWGVIGGICFKTVSRLRENQSLKILGIIFCIMFAWRLLIPLASKRYLMSLILPISVFALAGLSVCWELGRKKKIVKWCFGLIVFVSIALSMGKFFRGAQKTKRSGLEQQAEILRRDFQANGYHKAALISNSRDSGLFFFHTGIPGQHYSTQRGQLLSSVIQQKISQYDVCYLSIAERKNEEQHLDAITSCCIHSYYVIPILSGANIRYADKICRLYKIISISQPLKGQAAGLLRNGDFQIPDRQTVDQRLAQNIPFLASREEIDVPQDWILSLTNKRGTNFANWSMYYESDQDARRQLVFTAAECGLAMYSKTKLNPGDYNILCRASGSSDAALYFFLYSYDAQKKLTVQNVGYLTPKNDGKIERQLMIRASDLPPDATSFYIGFIASGKRICPKQIDIVQTDNSQSEK